jgi:hypothetical protein
MSKKRSNPKDAVGCSKPGLFNVPTPALFALAEAHDDGAMKYGSHNWRDDGVRAAIYLEAIDRHLAAWKEGEERAPDSDVHHLAHVMACCAILIDAQTCGQFFDDRSPSAPEGWMEEYRQRSALRRVVKVKARGETYDADV